MYLIRMELEEQPFTQKYFDPLNQPYGTHPTMGKYNCVITIPHIPLLTQFMFHEPVELMQIYIRKKL